VTPVTKRANNPVCRMCGATESLTKHHVLKRRSFQLIGENALIDLCRSCHDRLHSGSPEERLYAYDELRTVMTDRELRLLDHPERISELWESRLASR